MLSREQEEALKVLKSKINSGAPVTILQGPAGSGKALVHGSKIPTIEGFSKIEDLKVGDFVLDRNGNPTKVIGVYPQGVTKNYLITFEDGRQSKCSSEHLWSCYTSKGNLKTFTAQQIFERGVYENLQKPSNGYRFKIPVANAINYPAKETFLDPYLVGALLGDGCTLQSKLTISSADDFLIKEICAITGFEARKEQSNYNWYFTHLSQNVLTKKYLGQYKKELIDYSYNKRIPKEFLYNSRDVRIALLQGLMDTDGSVDLKGRCSFTTTSENLKSDFLQLVYSLGYLASVDEDQREEKYTKTCYRIRIQATEQEKLNFFRLPRKKEKIEQKIKKGNRHRNYNQIAITSIEQIEDGPSTCIAVENKEKLFLTEDFIVTHNTYLLKYLFESLGYSESTIAFVAYTGIASQVLSKQGMSASTIHSLIYTPIIINGYCVGFRKKPKDEITGLRLIVVDEFSMLTQDMLEDLLSYGVPLLLVGDQFQLPPIGKANQYVNLADVALTEIHRQALDNPILKAATDVREGRGLPGGIYGDTLWVGRKEEADDGWFRKDVQVITGLNKTKDDLNIVMAGTMKPKAGHKIIFLKNDWKNGITNGTIANINQIRDFGYSRYSLDFNADSIGRFQRYDAKFLLSGDTPQSKNQMFSYAYAISCHKAQGQTFDTPGIIFDESGYFRQDSKRWLYTALSRFTGNYNVAILR